MLRMKNAYVGYGSYPSSAQIEHEPHLICAVKKLSLEAGVSLFLRLSTVEVQTEVQRPRETRRNRQLMSIGLLLDRETKPN